MKKYLGKTAKLMILSLAITCIIFITLLFLFLYSKFAGEWASLRIIPLPPGSICWKESRYSNGRYANLLRICNFEGNLKEVREWLVSNGIPMSLSDSKDIKYTSLPFSANDNLYELLYSSAFLTGNPQWADYEFTANCFYISIYRTINDIDIGFMEKYFPNISNDYITNILLINTCWPNW